MGEELQVHSSPLSTTARTFDSFFVSSVQITLTQEHKMSEALMADLKRNIDDYVQTSDSTISGLASCAQDGPVSTRFHVLLKALCVALFLCSLF